jgi:hypothetical protein
MSYTCLCLQASRAVDVSAIWMETKLTVASATCERSFDKMEYWELVQMSVARILDCEK